MKKHLKWFLLIFPMVFVVIPIFAGSKFLVHTFDYINIYKHVSDRKVTMDEYVIINHCNDPCIQMLTKDQYAQINVFLYNQLIIKQTAYLGRDALVINGFQGSYNWGYDEEASLYALSNEHFTTILNDMIMLNPTIEERKKLIKEADHIGLKLDVVSLTTYVQINYLNPLLIELAVVVGLVSIYVIMTASVIYMIKKNDH